jgi:hypothetical protein
MTTAIQVAQELRKLADALEKGGETEIIQAFVCFSHWDSQKQQFLDLAKLMPRPFAKKFDDDEIRLVHGNAAMDLWVKAPRSLACRIVEPAREAVYECEPLLSEAEEAEVSA